MSRQQERYYTKKTREWLEREGYTVADAEVTYTTPGPFPHRVKRDVWGADLIARNEQEILMIQVKRFTCEIQKGKRQLMAEAPESWPACVRFFVAIWPPRKRTDTPDLYEVTRDTGKGEGRQ